jgi:hypothetical protein
VQTAFEGACAVMTGEDTDGKATQFRRLDQTLAGLVGSFHKGHAGIADERAPEPRRRGQNTKEMMEPPAQFHALWLRSSGSASFWA